MADIRPFAALRPAPEYTEKIASLPYDVYSEEEAEKIIRENPYSFLAIDLPEANPAEEEPGELLGRRVREGLFVKDDRPGYYVYAQTWRGRTQAGIVAVASVDDYLNGVIKKHENTRTDKEDGRVRHIESCMAHTGPIFLCYRGDAPLLELTERVLKGEPEADFLSGPETGDRVRNRVYRVEDEADIRLIRERFAAMDRIYVADGHHRLAAAARVALENRGESAGNGAARKETDYFLCVLFADASLAIMDYNRVVKDLAGHTAGELQSALKKAGFTVSGPCSSAVRPGRKGEFGLYLEKAWYLLTLDESLRSADPVDGLDVAVLQERVLAPLFGIGDPRTDKRIDFVGGIRGLKELERRCAEDCACAFSLYPTSLDELFAVADAGKLMPPKSTWFEPKLLSGLFIHPF